MDAEILATQIAVSQIPAPTGAERQRAAWIARRLTNYGLQVRTDDAGNVVARAPNEDASVEGAPPVVLAAHLDTVFPAGTDLEVRRENTRLIGPGISDNGRGLAAMLAIARVLGPISARWTRAVEFVATTSEEGAGDLRGARHYFARASRPFAVVVLDGAGDDCVVNTAVGSRRFRVEYRGPGGHSWAAHGTANPVHAVARAAASLTSLRLSRDGRSTLTVSRIGGGLSVNSIPGDAWIEVDVRGTSGAALARIERELHDIVKSSADNENHRAARGAVTFTVTGIGARPAGETSADSALVQSAMEATRLVARAPGLATASTDANAAMATGVPAIAIGGGGKGGDAHTPQEWYENDDAGAGVQRALTIVATMAALAAD